VTDWQSEVRWNIARRRDGVYTPFDEARKWRRRFFYALILLVALGAVLLVVMAGRRSSPTRDQLRAEIAGAGRIIWR